jgi:hypothetical protein
VNETGLEVREREAKALDGLIDRLPAVEILEQLAHAN